MEIRSFGREEIAQTVVYKIIHLRQSMSNKSHSKIINHYKLLLNQVAVGLVGNFRHPGLGCCQEHSKYVDRQLQRMFH